MLQGGTQRQTGLSDLPASGSRSPPSYRFHLVCCLTSEQNYYPETNVDICIFRRIPSGRWKPLASVVKYDYTACMIRNTRRVSWIKGARKDFEKFPPEAQARTMTALTMVSDGATPDGAKPLKGFGSGCWELALRVHGDAFRVVYALQLAEDLWVIHAFQKKSKKGIATPRMEIDLVRDRIKRLKEQLR